MNATTLIPTRPVTAAVLPQEGTDGLVDHEELRRSIQSLGECLAELSPTDPRWHALGVSVSTVADLVRRSMGSPGTTMLADLSPIVRLRDLAVAGRGLLGRDATIVDPEAARDAHARCGRILRELT